MNERSNINIVSFVYYSLIDSFMVISGFVKD